MPPAEVSRIEARVTGRVQGVGFRYFVHARARELHLAGSVRNLPDGGVWVEAEGAKGTLLKLLASLREGPPAAVVERVEVQWVPPRGAAEFLILAG